MAYVTKEGYLSSGNLRKGRKSKQLLFDKIGRINFIVRDIDGCVHINFGSKAIILPKEYRDKTIRFKIEVLEE